METQTLINTALAAMGFMGAWILNNLNESIRALKTADADLIKAVQHIEVLVAGSYVKRDDMDKLTNALFVKLDKIELKLDSKADKA